MRFTQSVTTYHSHTIPCLPLILIPLHTLSPAHTPAPIVSFQRQPLVVGETQRASFSVQRHGFNLPLTTIACYHLLRNDTVPSATPSEDFSLLGGCTQSHDHWCVTFAANQTEQTCTVFARPDDLLEGTETIFLELQPSLQFGELGSPTQLNITILDRTEREFPHLSQIAFTHTRACSQTISLLFIVVALHFVLRYSPQNTHTHTHTSGAMKQTLHNPTLDHFLQHSGCVFYA